MFSKLRQLSQNLDDICDCEESKCITCEGSYLIDDVIEKLEGLETAINDLNSTWDGEN